MVSNQRHNKTIYCQYKINDILILLPLCTEIQVSSCVWCVCTPNNLTERRPKVLKLDPVKNECALCVEQLNKRNFIQYLYRDVFNLFLRIHLKQSYFYIQRFSQKINLELYQDVKRKKKLSLKYEFIISVISYTKSLKNQTYLGKWKS